MNEHQSHAREAVPEEWQPMATAPKEGYPIEFVTVKLADGSTRSPCHYACDLSGEYQPPFKGWFIPDGTGKGYKEVHPVAWRPL